MTKNRILAGLCAATALALAPQAVAAQDSTDAAAAAEQTLTNEQFLGFSQRDVRLWKNQIRFDDFINWKGCAVVTD